jgi:hypothetical protein
MFSIVYFFGIYCLHSEHFISLTDGLIFTFSQESVNQDIQTLSNTLGLVFYLVFTLTIFIFRRKLNFTVILFLILILLFFFFPTKCVNDVYENF